MDIQTFDRHPVDVRGPLVGGFRHRQRVTTFARAFTANGKLYIAESPDLGKTVSQVTSYDIPEDEPIVKGNTIKVGPWVFSGCSTCRAGRSKWRSHTTDSLVALAAE
jgi:hypothetical protein